MSKGAMVCIRPQCGQKYDIGTRQKYCICGAMLREDTNSDNPERGSNNKDNTKNNTKMRLVLLLDDDKEVAFNITDECIIGIGTESNKVDIDLRDYVNVGDISKKQAMIFIKDGYYHIKNLTSKHSVHVNEKAVTKNIVKLIPGDMVLLSKKILFQFEEDM